MKSLSLTKFSSNVNEHKYNQSTLLDIRDRLAKIPSKRNTSKIKCIDQYLKVIQKRIIDDSLVAKKFLNLKSSAQQRNLEFNLSLSDVKRLLSRKTCYYTGLKFNEENINYTRSIDRIDSNKGYIKGNVVACVLSINQLKNQLLEVDSAFFKDRVSLLKKFVSKL